jgi:oxygen-independent coproporphyrinogen-3 oxidase
VRRRLPVDEYIDAVARELALRFPDSGETWHVDTVYLGGGTPSLLGDAGVSRLLEVLRERLVLAPEAELTLEANPEDVSVAAARTWRDAGINRISIGAQSFTETALRWMHRTHGADSIARAVRDSRVAGLDDVSLDLIFGLPDEVPRNWRSDLTSALSLEPTHLSLYGLTVEASTPLAKWRERGAATEASEERYESEYLLAHELMLASGFDHYEVSNFARPGRSARHNSAYWNGATYVGLGPSAHEFDGAVRRWNLRSYSAWLEKVQKGKDPIDGSEDLDSENVAAEHVYLGLRTAAGLRLSEIESSRVAAWVAAGWATVANNERLVLTALGWLRLDALAADLTVVRSHS